MQFISICLINILLFYHYIFGVSLPDQYEGITLDRVPVHYIIVLLVFLTLYGSAKFFSSQSDKKNISSVALFETYVLVSFSVVNLVFFILNDLNSFFVGTELEKVHPLHLVLNFCLGFFSGGYLITVTFTSISGYLYHKRNKYIIQTLFKVPVAVLCIMVASLILFTLLFSTHFAVYYIFFSDEIIKISYKVVFWGGISSLVFLFREVGINRDGLNKAISYHSYLYSKNNYFVKQGFSSTSANEIYRVQKGKDKIRKSILTNSSNQITFEVVDTELTLKLSNEFYILKPSKGKKVITFHIHSLDKRIPIKEAKIPCSFFKINSKDFDQSVRDNTIDKLVHQKLMNGFEEYCKEELKNRSHAFERDLTSAIQHGNVSAIQSLLNAYEANIDADIINGFTILIFASAERQYKVVQWALEKGADINKQNKLGRTGLHFAARYGDLRIVDILLEYGAEINIADIEGNTPITGAVAFNHTQIVSRLIEKGANITIKDVLGESLLDIAHRNGNGTIAKILRKNL